MSVNYSLQPHEDKVLQQIDQFGACPAGDLNNDQLKFCYVCKDRGFPHEVIDFKKQVTGRHVRSDDGSLEVNKQWILTDYFTGRIHQHRITNRSPPSRDRERGSM